MASGAAWAGGDTGTVTGTGGGGVGGRRPQQLYGGIAVAAGYR